MSLDKYDGLKYFTKYGEKLDVKRFCSNSRAFFSIDKARSKVELWENS